MIALCITLSDLSPQTKAILSIFFFLLSCPIFYFVCARSIVKLSRLLKDHNPEYYKANLGTKRYFSLYLIYVPIFGFVNDIEKTNNKEAIVLAEQIRDYGRLSAVSLLLSLLIFILQIIGFS